MQWNCLRSLSCCCRRAGDVLLCFKCTLEPDASKMLVVYDPNVCFEWIHDDVLADMNARHPIWWARDIATRFETWHRQRIRLQNRKWLKHLMLLSYTEYFWSLAPTRIQFGFPFLSSSFFSKRGVPIWARNRLVDDDFFGCANKISRCSLFIASRLQTALSSPRELHLLSSPASRTRGCIW